MNHISVLIKPASGLCNIRCKYCFYANVTSMREVRSYGKMTRQITEAMITNIFADLKDGDRLSLAFQGGEPTLAGLPYFQHLTEYVSQQKKRVKVDYAIQTNGILINDRWCRFLKEHNFLVGLSIDGHPIYHDLNRVDPRGRGTFHKVIETKRMFEKFQIPFNILCVLTNPLAKEAKKIYRFLREENIEYLQLIPCLPDLDKEEKESTSYALTPQRFASFYQQLFKLWLADLRQGRYTSIKLFDDILNLLVNQQITACGLMGNCRIQYVIEADGSVYPCDFYVLDEWRLGNITEKTLKQIFNSLKRDPFLCSRSELPHKCGTCPFKKICGGGCKRMSDVMYVDEQQEFCGYQHFLEKFIPNVNEITHLLGGTSQ
ncbi:anaerobic sulfatase maturase [Enterococcus dongliensis]|uniref:anaerobic sulfatase maturase n=1 Tax=Enterococcus dongliensis TaxID=2559925 RepID=UPI00288DB7B6|nr:anaerobic sulfatase maturase [Enterococcus dongliensis]MDT2613922.1 anaerobic sulfatase maturase [Enterococcus dongliensis]